MTLGADLTTALFGAAATSGTGASNVGVAGSLAINVGTTNAEALVASTANITLVNGTPLTLSAQGTTSDATTAHSRVDGSGNSTGVGASVSINIGDDTSQALLDTGSQLNGAGVASLQSTSNNTVLTDSKGGAAGGTATTPVVATSIENTNTLASVKSASASLSAQALSLSATHAGSATTTATGAAAGSLPVGTALAVGYVDDTTQSLLDRSLALTGALSIGTASQQTSASTAKASAKGGKPDDGTQNGGVDNQISLARTAGNAAAAARGARDSTAAGTTPKAQSAAASGASSVNVAGAVSINDANTNTEASIGTSHTVTVGGAATIASTANTSGSATADGTQVAGSATGVGAAVAINSASVSNQAVLGQSTSLTSDALTVSAQMPGTSAQDSFSAQATSGAGSTQTGIAGALAINSGQVTTNAQLASNSSVTITGSGSVSLLAGATANERSVAQAGSVGGNLGIGASVAVVDVGGGAQTAIQNGVTLTGVQGLTLTANDNDTVNTTALSGAVGGSPIAAGVGLGIVGGTTSTLIGTGAQISLATLNQQATRTESATTDVDGASGGPGVGVGASFGLTVDDENATSSIARGITTTGAATLASTINGTSSTTALASAQGHYRAAPRPTPWSASVRLI